MLSQSGGRVGQEEHAGKQIGRAGQSTVARHMPRPSWASFFHLPVKVRVGVAPCTRGLINSPPPHESQWQFLLATHCLSKMQMATSLLAGPQSLLLGSLAFPLQGGWRDKVSAVLPSSRRARVPFLCVSTLGGPFWMCGSHRLAWRTRLLSEHSVTHGGGHMCCAFVRGRVNWQPQPPPQEAALQKSRLLSLEWV